MLSAKEVLGVCTVGISSSVEIFKRRIEWGLAFGSLILTGSVPMEDIDAGTIVVRRSHRVYPSKLSSLAEWGLLLVWDVPGCNSKCQPAYWRQVESC